MWKKHDNSTATHGSGQDNRLHTFVCTLLIIVGHNIELGNGCASRMNVRTNAVFVTHCSIDDCDVRLVSLDFFSEIVISRKVVVRLVNPI